MELNEEILDCYKEVSLNSEFESIRILFIPIHMTLLVANWKTKKIDSYQLRKFDGKFVIEETEGKQINERNPIAVFGWTYMPPAVNNLGNVTITIFDDDSKSIKRFLIK